MAPKTALEVHEESWNAYPYTKTRFSVPFVDKFSLEVETFFEQDAGTQVQTNAYIAASVSLLREILIGITKERK